MLISLTNWPKSWRHLALSNVIGLTAWLGLSGCATLNQNPGVANYRSRLALLFDEDFDRFETPAGGTIKEGAVTRTFPAISVQEVWDSALFILAQRSVIIRADKETRVIVCAEEPRSGTRYLQSGFPSVLLIEPDSEGKNILVHANWLTEFFQRTDKPALQALGIQRDVKQKLSEAFFAKLATETYGKRKWKYLFN